MKTINNRSKVIFLMAILPLVAVSLMLVACGAKPPVVSGVEVFEPKVDLPQVIEPEKTETETSYELAQRLEKERPVIDVLRLYVKAIQSAPEQEKNKVKSSLNRFLATIGNNELYALWASDEDNIPRAEILYRLGLNYASQGENKLAVDTLVQFLRAHPDHGDAQNAQEIVSLLQQYLFKKNKVGCLLPLSGRFSMFGDRALKGIELAVQDLSNQFQGQAHDQFRDKITVVIKDTRSDNDYAATCVQELSAEKVAGIAGPIITAETAGKEAQQLGVPMIAMTQKSQVARTGDYVFSNFLTPEMQAQALASYASRVLQVKKFAILYPDDRYGRTYMNLFWDRVEEVGGEIVGAESYGDDQTDFSDAIRKLTGQFYPKPDFIKNRGSFASKDLGYNQNLDQNQDQNMEANLNLNPEPGGNQDLNPDDLNFDIDEQAENPLPDSAWPTMDFKAVFIPDAPSKVGMILPQLAYHDITDCYFLGTNIWHDDFLIRTAKKYAANAVITDGFLAKGNNQKARAFAERFHALYGEYPGFIEAAAYDTITMLVQTAMASGVNSREDLKRALAGKKIFEGVTGRTMFDPDGNAQKELVFITINQGEFREIDR